MAMVRVCVRLIPPDWHTQQVLTFCSVVDAALSISELFQRAEFWLATQVSQANYGAEIVSADDYTFVIEPSLGYEENE